MATHCRCAEFLSFCTRDYARMQGSVGGVVLHDADRAGRFHHVRSRLGTVASVACGEFARLPCRGWLSSCASVRRHRAADRTALFRARSNASATTCLLTRWWRASSGRSRCLKVKTACRSRSKSQMLLRRSFSVEKTSRQRNSLLPSRRHCPGTTLCAFTTRASPNS